MTLGEKLKKLRNEKALSQPDLANRAGIEQSYLSKLENDKSMPSNDIFRKLLAAFELSLPEFIAAFDRSYADSQLRQIPDIEHWLKQQQQSKILNQRKYLYICSALIVFAITLFFAGENNRLFSNTKYQYYSQGVVLMGEPKDIFNDWGKIIPRGDVDNKLFYKKKMEMAQRKDEKYVISVKYLGQSYVVNLSKGLRVYSLIGNKHIYNSANAWLQISGVFLFVMGIMGFILERRLYKKVNF